ncbi:hypothetical protein ACFX2G_006033 [Malus domestica]
MICLSMNFIVFIMLGIFSEIFRCFPSCFLKIQIADCVVLSGGAHNPVVLVDHLHELPDDERHQLDHLDFFLGAEKLTLQILLLVLDILLLDVDELELSLIGLEAAIEIILIRGLILVGVALKVQSYGGD